MKVFPKGICDPSGNLSIQEQKEYEQVSIQLKAFNRMSSLPYLYQDLQDFT